MNKVEESPDLNSQPPENQNETDSARLAKKRPNQLKKKAGYLATTSLLATSLFLSACGGQDCSYIYPAAVATPSSSGFTGSNTQNQAQPKTYCTSSGSSGYGSSYIFVGAGS